ncbi:uncharacterized protein LOC143285833 [Babylonia areolata]|uniref:uncharacterized protein LOC143285833 n=1 Tax=Babylonia areolata TaxID=304850 RepID=UPI003FD215CA
MSSAMSSESNNQQGAMQLSLVPRGPAFHPYFTGVGTDGYGDLYYHIYPYPGGLGSPQGAYPALLMMPPAASGVTSSTAEDGDSGGGGGIGEGERDAGSSAARGLQAPSSERYKTARKKTGRGPGWRMQTAPPPAPAATVVVMEHPSLRQLVILTAVLFLLAFVAAIITSVYVGRIAETPWNA